MRALREADPRSRRTIAALRALLVASIVVPALLFAAAAWQSRKQVLAAAGEAVETSVSLLQANTLAVLEAGRQAAAGPAGAGTHAAALRAALGQLESRLGGLRSVWGRQSGDSVAVLRRDGTILAHQPPMPPGTAPVDRTFAVAAAAAPEGGVYWAGHPPDGVARLVAYRPLGAYPAYIAFGLPRERILAGWWDNILLFGAVAFPASLALLWAAWVALGRAEQGARAVQRLAAEMARRESAEAALLQRHKMEAVGQLTGGIAHDFNNLLTVICGNLDRLGGTALDERQRHMAGAAHRAAARAASVAQHLLAFSRRQALRPEDFRLADRIGGTIELIERAVTAMVKVEVDIGDETWPIHADWAQLELALLNIAVNARDAMPNGGRLRLIARNVADAGALGLAGRFVAIGVIDTGTGMPPEIRARVFEPFFTTKEIGKGTGLGLSQVFGFATQSGGTATIDSAPGEGTTVTLYLPCAAGEPAPERARNPANSAAF